MQRTDLNKIYNLSINNKNIGAFFIHPNLINFKYSFNFTALITNDFDLNNFLTLNFNLIKINSIVEYTINNLNIDLINKIYDFDNLDFKDYIITFEENSKTQPYNYLELFEVKKLKSIYEEYFEIDKKLSMVKEEIEFNKIKEFLNITDNKIENELKTELELKIFYNKKY